MRTWFWALAGVCLSCSSAGPVPKCAESPGTTATAAATVAFHVPAIFGDHMLLQRDRQDPIWGWDRPGQTVTVTLDDKTVSAVAGSDGRWEALLPALPAGGPHTLTISGSETRRIEDVLAGEAWLASGQSNMEFDLGRASDAATVIPAAKKPDIRLFTVTRRTADAPANDVEGSWQVCSPDTVPRFSAVAYFFGDKLRDALGVPIGLVHSSWGGTPAEAWTSRSALAARSETKPLADRYSASASPEAEADYQKKKAEWHDKAFCKDPGNQGLGLHYAELEFDDSKWKELSVPGLWEEQGLVIDGAVWFRHAFVVQNADAKGDFELELGPIDDYDETYVNGQKVGGLGAETKDAWNTPRKYKIPSAVLKPGRNVIAVRAFDNYRGGGFHGAPTELRVFPSGHVERAQPLAGKWRTLVEWSVPQPTPEFLDHEPQPPAGPSNQNSPGVLFDGMIAPLVPYGFRGAIWYQGEANVGRAAEYRVLLPTLIGDWRTRFKSDLSFYIVELANFMARSPQPTDSAWAELRDAQAYVAATVPGAGLAVTIDIGEGGDIHPKNKHDVGSRLALVALSKTYGNAVEASGPTPASVSAEAGGKVRIQFAHAEPVLKLAGTAKKPLGFAVAGADRKFFWAEARLDGKSVVLSSKDVKEPRVVRYAWADNPEVNLVNAAGLPTGPFEAAVK